MKKLLPSLLFFSLLSSSLFAYASEASIRNYQKEFCKELSDKALQSNYDTSKAILDKHIAKGSLDCKDAGDNFNTQNATRKGKQLFDDCESYRYGEIRKEIHKLKIKTKALNKEMIERGIK